MNDFVPLSEDERAILRDAQKLEELVREPGWAILRASLESLASEETKKLLVPLDVANFHAAAHQEFTKGRVNALMWVLSLVENKIREAELLRRERGLNDDDET